MNLVFFYAPEPDIPPAQMSTQPRYCLFVPNVQVQRPELVKNGENLTISARKAVNMRPQKCMESHSFVVPPGVPGS